MHPAHQVPCRIPALQKILHAAFGFGQLNAKGRVQFPPQSLEHRGCQILRAHHGRRCQRHALQFVVRRGRNPRSLPRRIAILLRAESGHVARAKFAPIGRRRRQRGPGLVRSQQQKPVARSAFESSQQTVRQPAVETRRLGVVSQDEPAVRTEA